MSLSYQVALLLGGIAEAKASSINIPMAIAITDANGGLLHFGRMDATLPASPEIAVSKAYTAAALRMPTHKVGELAQPGGMLYGIQNSMDKNIILFGGGIPLTGRNQVIGAVGISGGTVQEDIVVAEFVEDSFEKMKSYSELLRPLLPGNFVKEVDENLLRYSLNCAFQRELPKERSNVIETLIGAILLLNRNNI